MRTSTLAQRPWHDCNVLRETVSLDGVELTLVDTAGLRDTPDEIEAEGIRRARAELARADLAVLIVDAHTTARALDALRAECPPGVARLIVRNKIDLTDHASTRHHARRRQPRRRQRIGRIRARPPKRRRPHARAGPRNRSPPLRPHRRRS